MDNEIHLYLGIVTISKKAKHKYKVGDRHAFLLYIKEEKDCEYNIAKAQEIIADLGYNEFEFTKMGKTDPYKAVNSNKKEFFESALKTGATFVLYSKSM